MNRNRRTQILIEDSGNLSAELALAASQKFTLEIREEAHLGLLMNPMRESAQQSLFYLGETLITRARVSINGICGLGLIIGENLKKAKELAIIDAAYPQLSETDKAIWDQRLLECQQEIAQQLQIKQAQINQTKVSFETMEVG